MKKKIDKFTLITTVLCLLPMAMGLAMYNQLPETMAVQWGVGNQVSNTAPKWVAVMGIPVLMAAITLLCNIGTASDPKKQNINGKLFVFVRLIPVILCFILYPISIIMNMRNPAVQFNIGMVALVTMGIIFVVIGNYLPKSKQSYTVGLKIPWTLDNEDNWNKTHRLSGYLWILCGLFMIVNGFAWQNPMIMLLVAVPCVAIPVVYSYVLYRRKEKEKV